MTQAHQFLYEEISKLPLEKVSKALSFIRYLEHEPEDELIISPTEEAELHELLASSETIDASTLLTRIMELLND